MAEDQQPRKIPLIFYRLRPGSEPVREWLKGLPEAERHAIGRDLLRAQWRWPVGMPLCRPLGTGLWEVVALHGFIKKTRTTPDDDLALTRKRQKELKR
jgi:phage-related protein